MNTTKFEDIAGNSHCLTPLSGAEEKALRNARFCAYPEALRRHIAHLRLPGRAGEVYRDLYALAVRERYRGTLALRWSRRALSAHLVIPVSTLARTLGALEAAGLISRVQTRHPLDPYKQGWSIIRVHIPVIAMQAIKKDSYRRGTVDERTTQAPGNVQHSEADVRPITGKQPECAEENRGLSEPQAEVAPRTGTPSQNNTGKGTEPSPVDWRSARSVAELWRRSSAAGEYRACPPGDRRALCEAIVGQMAHAHAGGSPQVSQVEAAIVAAGQTLPGGLPAVLDARRLARAIMAVRARGADRRNRPLPTAAAARSITIDAQTMRLLQARLQPEMIPEVAWALAVGSFSNQRKSPAKVINVVRKLIREGRWSTPFGYRPGACTKSEAGEMVCALCQE